MKVLKEKGILYSLFILLLSFNAYAKNKNQVKAYFSPHQGQKAFVKMYDLISKTKTSASITVYSWSDKGLNKAIKNSLNSAESLPEWLDKAYLIKQKWPNWATAISNVHTPNDETDFSPGSINYQRLAYDELLANQLALALIRIHTRKKGGRTITGNDNIKKKIISALPFDLTNSQVNAVRDITKDMSGDGRMHRLLQGDVGSGKTIVALLSMIHAIESGAQAALLAPTEILARQHLTTIEPLTNAVGVNVALLTAREKGKKRESIIEG